MNAFILCLCVLGVMALTGVVAFVGEGMRRSQGRAPRLPTDTETALVQQGSARREGLVKQQYGDVLKPGANFNASDVAPRLQEVRQDPVREVEAHPKPVRKHARLVAAAKGIITALPYFRDRAEVGSRRGESRG